MKFYKPFLAVILFSIFFSCSKDETADFAIVGNDANLKYDSQVQLSTTLGDGSTVWTSSDAYVGEVLASGQFVAKHIGETVITATWNGQTATTHIVVEPYITGITEPYLQFGESKASVKAFESRLLQGETETSLFYRGGARHVNAVAYLFENSRYVASALVFNTNPTSVGEEAAEFYVERYDILGVDNNVYYFTDKLEQILIGITVDSELGLVGLYNRNTASNRSSATFRNFAKQPGVRNIDKLDRLLQK